MKFQDVWKNKWTWILASLVLASIFGVNLIPEEQISIQRDPIKIDAQDQRDQVISKYTPSTETHCIEGHCNTTMYGATVFADDRGTKIQDAASLKDIWNGTALYMEYLEIDPDYSVEIIDFNYTSVTFQIWKERSNAEIPKVRLKNRNKSENLEVDYKVSRQSRSVVRASSMKKDMDFKDLPAKERVNITIDLAASDLTIRDFYMKWGLNSTTVTLNDASGLIKDSDVDGNNADTNTGTSTELRVGNVTGCEGGCRGYLAWDISSVNNETFIFTSATMSLSYSQTSHWGGNRDINVHHVYDGWTNSTGSNELSETGITWNNQPCGTGLDNTTNCNTTASITYEFVLSGSQSVDVKDFLEEALVQNNTVMSMVLALSPAANQRNGVKYRSAEDVSGPSISITYHINESVPPFFSSDSDSSGGSVVESEIVNVSVFWEDNLNFIAVNFSHNSSGSFVINSSCDIQATSGWCNKTIDTTGMVGKTVCWRQNATDEAGNTNNSMANNAHCFSVVDSTVSWSQNQTNNTDAGQNTLFSVAWNGTPALDSYIFSWHNGANWTNNNASADLEGSNISFAGLGVGGNTLVVDGTTVNLTEANNSDNPYGAIEVKNGGTLNIFGRVYFNGSSFSVDSSSVVNGDGLGPAGGAIGAVGQGTCGGDFTNSDGGGGGGYGGVGSDAPDNSVQSCTTGSATTDAIVNGSGGGGGTGSGSAPGGDGAGAIYIWADDIDIDGNITFRGDKGGVATIRPGGGGSGGGILLKGDTVDVSGVLDASGGDGGDGNGGCNDCGGGGGGGRIKIFYGTSLGFTGTQSVAGGVQSENSIYNGDAGSLHNASISYSSPEIASGTDPQNDTNATIVSYSDTIDAGLDHVTNFTIVVDITEYDNSASTVTGTKKAELYLKVYNGTDFEEIGNFSLSGTGNVSFVVTQANILSAWATTANRDFQLQARNLDYFNVTTVDRINWTGVWVTEFNTQQEFLNDSAVKFGGTFNWSNVTKTLTSTVGATIKWLVYANNTVGLNNQTPVFTFVTTDAGGPAPSVNNCNYPGSGSTWTCNCSNATWINESTTQTGVFLRFIESGTVQMLANVTVNYTYVEEGCTVYKPDEFRHLNVGGP